MVRARLTPKEHAIFACPTEANFSAEGRPIFPAQRCARHAEFCISGLGRGNWNRFRQGHHCHENQERRNVSHPTVASLVSSRGLSPVRCKRLFPLSFACTVNARRSYPPPFPLAHRIAFPGFANRKVRDINVSKLLTTSHLGYTRQQSPSSARSITT
jgi:hypothetical protein